MILPIYDLKPANGHCWIAPNATVGNLNIFLKKIYFTPKIKISKIF